MTVEEIQERHKLSYPEWDHEYEYRDFLLSEHARLTQELTAEKAVAEFSRETLQTATDLIKSLKLELAEERAACQIAGLSMTAMRTTLRRKDEEIRLLRAWYNAGVELKRGCENDCNGLELSRLQSQWEKTLSALEAFDKKNV